MFKTIAGICGNRKLIDLETLMVYPIEINLRTIGLFLILIRNKKVFVINYIVYRPEWLWWKYSKDYITRISLYYNV